jgi:hypothetical protein
MTSAASLHGQNMPCFGLGRFSLRVMAWARRASSFASSSAAQ